MPIWRTAPKTTGIRDVISRSTIGILFILIHQIYNFAVSLAINFVSMGSLDNGPTKDLNAKKVDFNIHPVIARDDIQLTSESTNQLLESLRPVSASGIQATSELNELPQWIPSPSVHMRKRPSRRTMNMSGAELELIEDEIVRLNTDTQVNNDETRKDMEFIPALAPGDRHKYTCKRVRVRESKPDSRTRHSLILPTRPAEATWRTTTPTTVNGGPGPEDLIYVSMQKDVLAKTVYPDAGCNIKDFCISIDPSELVEYLPSSSVTKVHVGEEQRELPAMSFDFIRGTTGEFYLLNTGISIWAMDWCALTTDHDPSGNGSADYLAVGGLPDIAQNCENRELFCKIGVQDAHPNMIQIWSMNCRTDMNKSPIGEPKAHLDICIVHDYGTVMDLKWCPSGNFSVAESGSHSGDISRLGILAAAFSDGCIRIYTIPATKSLRNQLGLHTPGDGQSTLFRE
ncbi:General transcription factor 3C polypeptide 2 [Mortierella polycephala]|uniref:General transcription factor 3C polypeptide 2 n=1 Tax=Mortierella polycephala TaxID=41804 RepID=A0A9P6Q4N4_9FUNG|nr:General transcription factor 3C polypeptide 2 [Mortierella polycephala]